MSQRELARELSKSFSQRRRERINRLKKTINPASLLEEMHGNQFRGRKTDGTLLLTLTPSPLGIILNGRIVALHQYRDDLSALRSIPHVQADELVKLGAHRYRRVRTITDIFHAIRCFMHIRESYHDELVGNSELREIEAINAILATINAGNFIPCAERLLKRLQKVEEKTGKRSASKAMGVAKLHSAIEILSDIVHGGYGFNFSIHLNRACALLVAFRNRIGDWRVEEALRRGSKAYLKECSLRRVRDELVKDSLRDWMKIIDENHSFQFRAIWEKDREMVALADGFDSNNGAEVIGRLLRMGNGHGTDFLGQANRSFAAGDVKAAYESMRKFRFYLLSNKPDYVAEQLERTGDSYLVSGTDMEHTVVAYIKAGAKLFHEGVFERAKYCFEEALKRMP